MDSRTKAEVIFKAFLKSPIYFAKFMWANTDLNYYYIQFAAIHYYILDRIINAKKQISIICVPRGFGKSKLVSVLYVIWAIFVDQRNFVIMVSYSSKKAEENLQDIAKLIDTKKFKSMFPWSKGVWRLSKQEAELHININDRKTGKVIRTAIIRGIGTGGSILGASAGANRPDLEIWDDLEDTDKSIVKEQVDKVQSWINKTALPGVAKRTKPTAKYPLGRTGKIVYIGTPHAPGAMIERAMSRKWNKNVQVTKIPALAEKDFMSEKIFDGINGVAIRNHIDGLEWGESIWKDMWSTEELKEKRDEYISRNELSSFLLEYQMDSSMETSQKFDLDKNIIIPKDKKLIQTVRDDAIKIITIFDLAYSQKSYSDYTGENTTAHFSNNKMIVLCGTKYKMNQNQFYERLMVLDDAYSVYGKRYQQYCESLVHGLIQAWLNEMNIKHGRAIEILPIKESTKLSKENRISRLIPWHNAGYIEFVEDECIPLFGDMSLWDGSVKKRAGGDDALDAFAYQRDFAIQDDRKNKEVIKERKRKTPIEEEEEYFERERKKKRRDALWGFFDGT